MPSSLIGSAVQHATVQAAMAQQSAKAANDAAMITANGDTLKAWNEW
jgi:hypothetical protein